MAISNSIVDYMKSIGQDSSYAARKKLAEENGITGYSGTAAQNMNLMQILKNSQGSQQQASSNVTTGVDGAANASAPSPTTGAGNASASYKASGSATLPSFERSDLTNSYLSMLQDAEANRPGDYEESDRVRDYYERLQDAEANKPDAFQSKYEEQINNILNGILNTKEFSYGAEDLANDSLYQMYRDNYTRQGNLAMRDAMGNAAALTGGYGSTYASAAGQQAYDNYLSQMNDVALEMADRAYQQYLNAQAEKYNQLGAVTGLDNTDYSRYRDTVSDYYNDLSYLSGRYDQEYAKDYGQYRDSMNDFYNNLSYLSGRYDSEYGKDFGEYQQDTQNQQWAEEYAFQQAQAAQDQANWEAEMAFQREQYEYQKQQAAAKAASGGSGSRSSSKSTGSTKSSANTGYIPLSSNLSKSLKAGTMSDYEALETVMKEMEKGNLTVDEAEMAIQDAGIDKQAAMAEEAQSLIPKNLWELRLMQAGR